MLKKSLRQSGNILKLKWITPYLVVPVLFIASMLVQGWLRDSGLIPYLPVVKRSVFSLWHVAVLTILVATPVGTLYLSEFRTETVKQRIPFTNFLLRAAFPVFLLTTAGMVFTSAAILLPMGVKPQELLSFMLTRWVFLVLWSTATATVCSSITSGSGGAVLSLGLFSIALLPGLSGSSLSWWFAAPLGSMSLAAYTHGTGWSASIAVTAHSIAYFLIAYLTVRNRH